MDSKFDSLISKISKRQNVSKEQINQRADEILRCKDNPLYFIYNYVYIPEMGGKIKVTPDNLNPKLQRVIRCLYKYNKVVFMASRQLGKSTVSAMILAWAMIFYPKNRAIILNMKKEAAFENLNKIRFITENLPEWMVTSKPFKSDSVKGALDFFNNSTISASYPSTVHDPSTLARSLTAPILYIDECAFIRHMEIIYTSAQQTLATATAQAIKNKYPWFTLITSTPI